MELHFMTSEDMEKVVQFCRDRKINISWDFHKRNITVDKDDYFILAYLLEFETDWANTLTMRVTNETGVVSMY